MRQPQPFIALVIPLIFLAGCEARYRDVSDELVGSSCELVAPMRAHGVTKELGQDPETDYVSIWNPGFTGPEVTFVVPLQPGVQMQVLSARECSNCLFDRLREYQVEVTPEPSEFAGKPAYVRGDSLSSSAAQCGAERPNNSFKPKPLRGSA